MIKKFTSCSHQHSTEHLWNKRFAFKLEAGREAKETVSQKPKTRAETLGEKYEKAKENLADPVKAETTLEGTMKKLASRIDGSEKTKTDLMVQFTEEFEKTLPGKKVEEFFKFLGGAKGHIAIEQEGDEWRFIFSDKNKKTFDLESGNLPEILAGTTKGVAIDKEEPADKEQPKVVEKEPQKQEALKKFEVIMGKGGKVLDSQVGTGAKFSLPRSRELYIYTDKNTRTNLDYEKFGDFRTGTFTTKEAYRIQLKGRTYIYGEALADGSIRNEKLNGWVEEKRLTLEDASKAQKAEPEVQIQIDEKKIEEKQKLRETAQEAAEKRAEMEWNKETGLITFTGSAKEKWEKTKNVTINKLFPHAVEGAQVMVTDKYTKKPKVATLKEGKWRYENGQVAKIFDGFKVVPLEKATIEIQERPPSRPKLESGYTFLETKARKLSPEQHSGSWNGIAKEIMKEFPQVKENGYNAYEYAKILAFYATDEGHYWAVLPPKTEAVLKAEVEQEKAERKKEATERTAQGMKRQQEKLNKQYKNYEKDLWDDRKFEPELKIRDLANDKEAWNREWAEGDLLNVARIKQAFRLPPFRGVPEGKIRDGLRNVIHYNVGANGIELSYLIEEFNKHTTLYTTLDGKKGDLGDMRNDMEKIRDARKQVAENKKEGRALNADMGADEWKAYQVGREKMKEMRQLGIAAVEIIMAVSEYKTTAESKKFVDTSEALKFSPEDKQAIKEYRKYIYGVEGNGPEMMAVPERMDEILNDQEKWNELWDSERGGFGKLKQALQQYPYSKIPLGVYRVKMFNMLGDEDKAVEGPNEIGMENILAELNENGELYRTMDGGPGDVDDFIDEYYKADIAHRYKLHKLNEKEMEDYKDIENPQAYAARYYEFAELWKSTAHVIEAVRRLDPDKEAPSYKGVDTLNAIFPPADTGSINGKSQDYYDIMNEDGEVVSGGLFQFDHSDPDSKISRLDKTTSAATANAIILDQCSTGEGTVDMKLLESRLNQLMHVGIAALIAEPESPQRSKNLEMLGIGKDVQVGDKEVVPKIAQKFTLKNLENSQDISKMQRELVQLGFIVETAGAQGEVKERAVEKERITWSTDPNIREIQRVAAEAGATPEEIKEIETKVESKLAAFFDLQIGKNFSGIDTLGVTIPIKIAGGEKGSLYIALGAEWLPQEGGIGIRLGIGGSVEVAENWSLVGGVGGSAGAKLAEGGAYAKVGAGLGVAYKIPGDEEDIWEGTVSAGIGAGFRFSLLPIVYVGPGVGYIETKNMEKEYQQTLKKELSESIFANVEKAKTVEEKAMALRMLPEPHGRMMTELQYNMEWSDAQLVSAYNKYFRKIIEEAVAKNETISPMEVTAWGVGIGWVTTETGEQVFIPGVALAFAIGSELKVFQRPSHSTEQLSRSAEGRMEKQAGKYIEEAKAAAQKAGYKLTLTTFSDELVGTMETGLQPVKKEASESILSHEKSADQQQIDKVFTEYQKELASKGLKLSKVPSEKMYKLEVLNAGNWQLYVDPAMQERMGVFLKNGEVYLSASKNPDLVIKKVDYYYPRPKDGNIKHTIITISDQDYRTQEAIMNESDYYLDSRTKDQTGRKRFPVSHEAKTRGKARQFNLREWKEGEDKGYFDNLEKVTPETQKYREQQELFERLAKSGRFLRERVGEANIEGVDLNDMRARAEKFMAKHPREYRLLTTDPQKKPGDIKKVFELISAENEDLNSDPDQIHAIMEELFNLSMADEKSRYEKLPDAQRKLAMKNIVKQRLTWMKQLIYVPFFKEHLNAQNNPNGYSAEEVTEAFLKPIRDAALENPESIPTGARLDVAVGTQSVFGRRGFNIAHGDKIPDHKIFVAKDYASALETGQPPMDKTIALVIREAESPTEFPEQSEFLASPLAMKLALMGTANDNPILGHALGEEDFNKIVECYNTKPPVVGPDAQAAVERFQEVVRKLRAAQEGAEGQLVVIDGVAFHTIEVNGVRLGIRTGSIKSGVYERCLNASKLYDEQLIAINEQEQYELVGNMRVYNAKTSPSLVTSFRVQDISIGFGVTAPVGPEPEEELPPPKKPPGDEPEPERPVGGPKGEVSVDTEGPGTNAAEGKETGQEHSNE